MNADPLGRSRCALRAGVATAVCLLLAAGLLSTVARAEDQALGEVSADAESSEAPSSVQEDSAGAPVPAEADAGEGSTGAIADDDIEIIVVEGSLFDDARAAIAERAYSDELVNVMTAEDFAKFSAVDVADALKRIAGLNVVEGQFAIIRGLEDRYSSTLFNGAAIPSPDPDSQSIQLDLFPSEVVNNLVVSKTFGPDLPSNSSGGSIDIVTTGYPEGFETGVKAKGGFNDNAIDNFLDYQDGSPVGKEIDGWDTLAQEYGGTVGGRSSVVGREIRYKLVGNWGVDYDTAEGFQQDREPRARSAAPPDGDLQNGELSLTKGYFDLTQSDREEQTAGYGAFGFDFDEASNHSIDLSLFWTQKNEDTVQLRENGYFPGLDYLKPDGAVERELNGDEVSFDTAFDGTTPGGGPGNATLDTWIGKSRNQTNDDPTRGPLWLSSFLESKSFKIERDLLVPQINGDHRIDELPGLHIGWAANYAKTTQKDDFLGARMWYEPCGYSDDFRLTCPSGTTPIPVPTEFPVTVGFLGPGKFIGNNDIVANDNDIDEQQWFGRLDGEYETELSDWLALALRSGGWYEHSTRDITSNFLPSGEAQASNACIDSGICGGGLTNPVYADTLAQLGDRLFNLAFNRGANGLLVASNSTESEAKREIQAVSVGTRTTLWDDLDLLAGLRFENFLIESNNDPFVEGLFDLDGSPQIFPQKWLLFDRLGDNVVREGLPRNPPFNDQVLGLRVLAGPCRGPNPAPGVAPPPTPVLPGTCVDLADQAEIEQFINGEIDESQYLPSVGLTYRPIEGLALRAAWSQTVARPSFREMGYSVTVEPASDDLIVGNPQLQLSDVESWDARVEYFFGDSGDLVAASGFYKTIEDPIESIIVRNPADFLDSTTTNNFRTFFNNPNEATLWGIELEARKNLSFLGEAGRAGLRSLGTSDFSGFDFLDYLSLGGNFTWIDAEVDRTEAELARSQLFFAPGSTETQNQSRRLFGQPEWIVNTDVSFDHPDWGTRATLAFYAISDVLDAAGSATIGRNGQVVALTLDRYVDAFQTLDLIVKQSIWEGLALKLTVKNLTDSRREIVYDRYQTSDKVEERSYKIGRDYSLELSYTFYELPFLAGD